MIVIKPEYDKYIWILEYSNISNTNICLYINLYNFLYTNIFEYSFVSFFLIQIYPDICLYQNHLWQTEIFLIEMSIPISVPIVFVDTNIFGYSFT